MRNKEYEPLINESPIFRLNKEESPSEYDREHYKLIENVFIYLGIIDFKPNGEQCIDYSAAWNDNYHVNLFEHSIEIIQTIESCLKSYNSDKGLFTHYFERSLSNVIKNLKGNNAVDNQLKGLIISPKTRKSFSKLKQCISADSTILEKSVNEIAEILGESVENTRYLLILNGIKFESVCIHQNNEKKMLQMKNNHPKLCILEKNLLNLKMN